MIQKFDPDKTHVLVLWTPWCSVRMVYGEKNRHKLVLHDSTMATFSIKGAPGLLLFVFYLSFWYLLDTLSCPGSNWLWVICTKVVICVSMSVACRGVDCVCIYIDYIYLELVLVSDPGRLSGTTYLVYLLILLYSKTHSLEGSKD